MAGRRTIRKQLAAGSPAMAAPPRPTPPAQPLPGRGPNPDLQPAVSPIGRQVYLVAVRGAGRGGPSVGLRGHGPQGLPCARLS